MSCCSKPMSAAAVAQRHMPAAAPIGWRLLAGLFIAGNSMALSLAVNLAEVSASERTYLHAALAISTVVTASLCGPVLLQALRASWSKRQFGVESLFVTGIVGAAGYSGVNAWRTTGDVYFEVVNILLALYALANGLKQLSQNQLQQALLAAMPQADRCRRLLAPREAVVAGKAALGPLSTTRAYEDIEVAQLKSGDIVEVGAQQRIPISGTIAAGAAFINEATLTGEGFCVSRGEGDAVQAGTFCMDGTLLICASADGGRGRLDSLFAQMLAGSSKRARVEQLVQRVARIFFPIVASAATATFLFWLYASNVTTAFLHAMAVLLVACPCALGFATPIGLWTAVVRLGRLGIHTRNTAAVEALAQIDTVVFDKTGTLTQVQPSVQRLHVLPPCPYAAAQIAQMAAAAQSASDHPVAAAFAQPAKTMHENPWTVTQVRILPGRGITVQLQHASSKQSVAVTVGAAERLLPEAALVPMSAAVHGPEIVDDAMSPAFLAEQQAAYAQVRSQLAPGARAVAIFIEAKLAAVAEVVDTPLPDAQQALSRLKEVHINSIISSGDSSNRLHAFASVERLGDMQPEDKLRHVQALQQAGHSVCFVGDGVNDAAAMATSQTSFAIDKGAAWAQLSADFSLPQSSVTHLADAVVIARQTMRCVRGNLYFAASYNGLGMLVAAAGYMHPVFATVLMLCSSLFVTLRSSALLQQDSAAPVSGTAGATRAT